MKKTSISLMMKRPKVLNNNRRNKRVRFSSNKSKLISH